MNVVVEADAKEEVNRLSSLDSLRGFAAAGVAFFFHYSHFNTEVFTANPEKMPLFNYLKWFYYCGWNLVDFFFVLSGFIFMYVYGKRIAENKITEENFFILRFSRLYPLHIATLLLVAAIQYFRIFTGQGYFDCQYNDIYHFMLNVFFLQAGFFNDSFSFNGPSWSLTCEALAYIMFFYTMKKAKRPVFVFLFYMFAGISILQMRLNYPVLNAQIGRMLMAFFAGCLLFYINSHLSKLSKKAWRAVLISLSLYSLLVAGLIAKTGYSAVFGHWERVMPLLVYPLMILLLLNVSILGRFFSLKPFTVLGDLSYSIYLLHFPVQLLMVTFLPMTGIILDYTKIGSLLIYVAITLTLAAFSHYLFEKPLQRIIRRKLLK
ncbi:MAG TPA: acyltransferase [Spirochaetota bacterium]|nr:acyltransferase [Spirochaetota bacterium]